MYKEHAVRLRAEVDQWEDKEEECEDIRDDYRCHWFFESDHFEDAQRKQREQAHTEEEVRTEECLHSKEVALPVLDADLSDALPSFESIHFEDVDRREDFLAVQSAEFPRRNHECKLVLLENFSFYVQETADELPDCVEVDLECVNCDDSNDEYFMPLVS